MHEQHLWGAGILKLCISKGTFQATCKELGSVQAFKQSNVFLKALKSLRVGLQVSMQKLALTQVPYMFLDRCPVKHITLRALYMVPAEVLLCMFAISL